jgi:hypothetical protein
MIAFPACGKAGGYIVCGVLTRGEAARLADILKRQHLRIFTIQVTIEDTC